jgi:S1-C subfamily serine protease
VPQSSTIPSPTSTTSAPPADRPGRSRGVLTGAIAGAVVGALAATGVFYALDDDGGRTTTIVQRGAPAVSRPSTNIEGAGDIAAIISRAEPAVVAITTGQGPSSGNGGAGTGFVITGDGFIVTNNHVVEGQTDIEVAFTDGQVRDARIVGRDPSADLSVLKVDAQGLAAVQVGDSDGVQVGDEVVAIGNALALEGGLSVTRGIISGLDRNVSTNDGAALLGLLQTDAAINPGNSGGPLLDAQARVVGINTAIADPGSADNVGFAIPISKASPIIEDLRLGRTPAFLGVSSRSVTPAVARELDLQVDEGAYVTRVGNGAEEAGIEEGDVILQIGGEQIAGADDVQAAVRSNRPGDTVDVVVDRNGERRTFAARLSERPDDGG